MRTWWHEIAKLEERSGERANKLKVMSITKYIIICNINNRDA